MANKEEPSAVVRQMLDTLRLRGLTRGMTLTGLRGGEFRSLVEAQLTGVALDPTARTVADLFLDAYWAEEQRRTEIIDSSTYNREAIIGSGFHAAVYAATRVRMGYPRPIVLERSARAGGTFAMTKAATFWLNSRNRPGSGGLAGDQGASLNYLPSAPLQAANIGMSEFQSNVDMARIIRFTLAQNADVLVNANVSSVRTSNTPRFEGLDIEVDGFGVLQVARVIDARGLGDPKRPDLWRGKDNVYAFPEFMDRMQQDWPLRGLKRVAVLGGGDSGKCAVEALLGIGPEPVMASAALDHVERIDWYAVGLPGKCKDWRRNIRGRYAAIGRYLRADRFGVRRLNVIESRRNPLSTPDGAVVEGRRYDAVIMCIGNEESSIDGLSQNRQQPWSVNGDIVATRDYDLSLWRVGPHANIPFTARERADGIADEPNNVVSMFRTAKLTEALAVTLPAITPLPERVAASFTNQGVAVITADDYDGDF